VASQDLVKREDDDFIDPENESGLTPTQIKGLEGLERLGAEPRAPDAAYDKDPQIRAYQMMFEGRLGGKRPGQGRPRRAAQKVAERVRDELQGKIFDALKDGLDPNKATTKERLGAADLALKIEREERQLELKEDQQDEDEWDKERLIAEFIKLASTPQAEALIQETITLSEDQYREVNGDDTEEVTGEGEAREGASSTTGIAPARPRRRSLARNERGAATRSVPNGENPFKEALKRRASKR
jgi:hypothetical protein